MSQNPFIASFEHLPETLPVFPLPGVIVMPGNELPLNIFEPRYLNMVNDALGSHRMIGMIQPDPENSTDTELCRTGCAGRITQYRETPDGRIELMLSGVCRFDIKDILPTTRGYRLVVPEWSRFVSDYSNQDDILPGEHDRLVGLLKRYVDSKGIQAEWDVIEQLPTVKLMNSLSMALPISEQDKQLLLETVEPEERLTAFIAMLGSELQPSDTVTRH